MRTMFLLLAYHYVADFSLQGDWMARNKMPGRGAFPYWFHVMLAHCMIQALGVYLATNSVGLALGELAAHLVIDYSKCRNWIDFNVDQLLHILCKIAWFVILVN